MLIERRPKVVKKKNARAAFDFFRPAIDLDFSQRLL